MRILSSMVAICAAICSVSSAAQESGNTPELTVGQLAGAFGARPAVKQISISPNGKKIAYIGPANDRDDVLYVVAADGSSDIVPLLEVAEENTELQSCFWATDDRLLCRLRIVKGDGGLILGYSRLFAMKDDGTDAVRLTEIPMGPVRQSQYGGEVIAREVPGKSDMVLMSRPVSGGLGVEEVSVVQKRERLVQRGNSSAVSYLADENADVRLMMSAIRDGTGYAGDEVAYFYKDRGASDWTALSRAQLSLQSAEGFRPVAVRAEDNTVFGFEKIGGYDALVKMKLDGSTKREVVLSRDDVDVDSLIRIGRKNRIVGVSYATEKRMVQYLDPQLDALAASLSKALPDAPAISWLDASDGEDRLLLAASSDTDPGMIYLYDKASRRLSEVLPVRDYLGNVAMGDMRPITYEAKDGTKIPGYLTVPQGSDGKNLPTVVMPHGGPASRDEWGFDWLVQFFVARGYAVAQPNFRGSAGYGDAWLGRNGYQAWETAVGDVNDAGRWLVSQGIANPAKLAIVGWSYGGYAALQSQVIDPQLFKAVVAIAPVTDLNLLIEENRKYSGFVQYKDLIGEGPHIVAGSPARQADKFQAPVLLFHGELDQNVADAHSELMERRLKAAGKSVRYIAFDDLEHDLDSHGARSRLLLEADTFLSQSLGQ